MAALRPTRFNKRKKDRQRGRKKIIISSIGTQKIIFMNSSSRFEIRIIGEYKKEKIAFFPSFVCLLVFQLALQNGFVAIYFIIYIRVFRLPATNLIRCCRCRCRSEMILSPHEMQQWLENGYYFKFRIHTNVP